MIRILIKLILILFFLIFSGIIFLVTTNSGLHWSTKEAEKWVPGLTIQKSSGDLLKDFTLNHVHFQNKDFSLTISTLHWQWNFWQLLRGNLRVNDLEINHAVLHLFKQEKGSTEKFQLKLPFNLLFENVTVKDFKLYPSVLPTKSTIVIPTKSTPVIPAKAGIQANHTIPWIPASAGITTRTTAPIEIHHLQFFFQGSEKKQQLQAQLKVKQIIGTIEHTPLNGHFNLSMQGNNFSLHQAEMLIGSSTLRAHGYLNQNWQIDWQLNIPNFNEILPHASGRLQSQGKIQGPRTTPYIKANLLAQKLQLPIDKKNIRANYLTGNIQANLSQEGQIDLSLKGQDLAYNQFTIKSLILLVNGKTDQHHINLSINDATTHLTLDLTGALQQSHWRGQVNELSLLSQDLGDWHTIQNASLTIAKNQLHLAPLCFLSDGQKFCTELNWRSNQSLQAQWQGQNFNLTQLSKLFLDKNKKDFLLNGKLNFQGNMNLSSSGKAQVYFNTTLLPGSVSTPLNDSLHTFAYKSGNIQLQINQKGLLGKANIDFDQQQNLMAQFSLPDLNRIFLSKKTNNFSEQPLQGNIDFQVKDISWLQALLSSDVQNIRGLINLHVKLAGTIANPTINGQIKLTNGYVDIPDIGINLKNITIIGTGNSQGEINWQGAALAGMNWLHFNGQSQLFKSGFPTQLFFRGNNLLIANTSEYKIFATPNAQFNYIHDAITITGTVKIPKATILSEAFNRGSVTLPDDVIFVDKTAKTKETSTTQFSCRLEILLGNDVSLNSNGATGQLTGGFLLNYDPQSTTTASGEINIINGKYNAYGQNLKIRMGKLFFSGGPITNPNINIEAIRMVNTKTQTTSSASLGAGFLTPTNFSRPGQVLVGIRITGPLHDYRVDLFSQPAIYNQTDILSLLILGTTSTQISAASGQILLSAASQLNLGGNQVSNITNQLQNVFGLDQLGITSESEYNPATKSILQTPSLSVGKAIGTNIFLNYSLGLFNPISILRLRYNLNDNWSIQTDASTLGHGIDLYYQVETK